MSRRALLGAILAVVAGVLAPQAQALGLAGLRAKLARHADQMGRSSGFHVRDLDSGRTLFTRRAHVARVPASNEKLLVTAAALMRLGPHARLTTALVAESAPVDGVVRGDVALVGGGDPYLSSGDLRLLARRAAALGVERISGRLLGDGTLLDARRGSYDSGWAWDRDLGGSLGGLVVDRGRGTDPALYAAQEMRRALLRSGVRVSSSAGTGTVREPAATLARTRSDDLGTLAVSINVPSDNFAAELLLKDLGALAGGDGSTPGGAAVARRALRGIGVRATMVDGSGLSRANRVTPRALVTLLDVMAQRPEGPALRASLPIAGRTGTLAERMRRGAARDRCQAKTGTLDGVSALSGYCTTTGGVEVAFSLLENGVCSSCAKRIEDRMVRAIARYRPAR